MASTTITATQSSPSDSSLIPLITLDTTLHALLAADSPGTQIETLCQLKPNSDTTYG